MLLYRAVSTGIFLNLDTHPPFRSLFKHKVYPSRWLHSVLGPQAPFVRFLGEIHLSYLLGTLGPPRFDPAMGDRMGGPPPTLRIVPRERTQDSLGVGLSSSPVRLTQRLAPGPCASLTPDLTDDPKAAQIVPSTYTVM